jgi:hypothetical protein
MPKPLWVVTGVSTYTLHRTNSPCGIKPVYLSYKVLILRDASGSRGTAKSSNVTYTKVPMPKPLRVVTGVSTYTLYRTNSPCGLKPASLSYKVLLLMEPTRQTGKEPGMTRASGQTEQRRISSQQGRVSCQECQYPVGAQ